MGARKSVATKPRGLLRTAGRGAAGKAPRPGLAVRSGPEGRLGSPPRGSDQGWPGNGGWWWGGGSRGPRPQRRSSGSPAWGGRRGAAEGARDRPLPGPAAGGRCRGARRGAPGAKPRRSTAALGGRSPAGPGRAESSWPARRRGAGCAQGQSLSAAAFGFH